MTGFRRYSDKLSFRERSEAPEIVLKLSLLPWTEFGTDAVILFSDILTPLPALGVDFDIISGEGPLIRNPIASADDVSRLKSFGNMDTQVPFIKPALNVSCVW
jgi:uroporphyrinogen decarboxylase